MVIFKELISKVPNWEGVVTLNKEFQQFLWEGVMVLEELIFNSIYFG